MKRLIILMLLLTSPALAQQIPGLYRVTGVASDDVLNVRENPRNTASIIGIFGHDSAHIEVVGLSDNRDWGHVNFDGGPGWVSMRYLELMDPLGDGTYLDKPLWCSGTEPFWSLAVRNDTAVFSGIEPGEQTYPVQFKGGPVNRMPGRGTLIARLGEARLTATVVPRDCDDGMSDKVYGLSIDLLHEKPGQTVVLEGCCQLDLP